MTNAEYWNTNWTQHSDMPVNNFARRAYRRIREHDFNTLLDLGCGPGQDSLYFARRGLRVTALDTATAGLERIQRQDSRITCLNQDFCRLALADNSFQVVYAHLSLQYFDDTLTRRIFANIYRILQSNGLFFVKCKSVDDPLFGEGELIAENMFLKKHLRHFFSLQYMHEMLEHFTILSLRRTSSHYGRVPSRFIEAVAIKPVLYPDNII